MPELMSTQIRPLEYRIERLVWLLDKLVDVPPEWIEEVKKMNRNGARKEFHCEPCSDYKVLINSWRKALKWTDGLDHALSVMLASVASTRAVGDQLWIKVVGPAACGKSTLSEAISVNKDYVVAKSTIRGLHSGWSKDDAGGKENSSLILKLKGKTLIIKDGDTLLQSPNLGQILAEFRDAYDRTCRSDYRNNMGMDHEGIDMTVIFCGTSSLRAIDSSELGERTLDCVIMEEIEDELEDEILWRVANRADRNLSIETDGKPEAHYEPELAEAMSLTGGYVSYLRENASSVLASIDNPEPMRRYCTRLGKFVAHMRARPSLKQEESNEREFAARLVSQLIRLAKCLAFVFNKSVVDSEVMARVRRVALDTSRGQTLAIAVHLYGVGDGSSSYPLAMLLGKSDEKVKAMLRFMKQIKIVESFTEEKGKGLGGRIKWRLTARMRRLYSDVMEG